MPKPRQFDRQRAADVGQSARLGKRHRFASGQQDIHEYALRRGILLIPWLILVHFPLFPGKPGSFNEP